MRPGGAVKAGIIVKQAGADAKEAVTGTYRKHCVYISKQGQPLAKTLNKWYIEHFITYSDVDQRGQAPTGALRGQDAERTAEPHTDLVMFVEAPFRSCIQQVDDLYLSL